MATVAARSLIIALVSVFCVAAVAWSAPLPPEAINGRWVSQERKLTLDISRCGEGWCGVEVRSDASCGRTQLHVAIEKKDVERRPIGDEVLFGGRLDLAANTLPYVVQAALSQDEAGLRLFVRGHTGGIFSAMRRTYDFNGLFVRTGEPTCRHDPKLS